MSAWVGWMAETWTVQTMPVAPAAEKCVRLVPLWKLARVESVCNVGHRHGRNGSAGLDGCYEDPQASSQIDAQDVKRTHDTKV